MIKGSGNAAKMDGGVMRRRFALAAFLAGIFTIAFGMLAIFRVYLLAVPTGSSNGIATISFIVPDFQVGLSELVTWLNIKYFQQIDDVSSENVTAEVYQTYRIHAKEHRLPDLDKPVRMSLQSAGFDFGNDDGNRFLPAGTKTPVSLTWTPIPRQAGKR
jgi:hypothetical protein